MMEWRRIFLSLSSIFYFQVSNNFFPVGSNLDVNSSFHCIHFVGMFFLFCNLVFLAFLVQLIRWWKRKKESKAKQKPRPEISQEQKVNQFHSFIHFFGWILQPNETLKQKSLSVGMFVSSNTQSKTSKLQKKLRKKYFFCISICTQLYRLHLCWNYPFFWKIFIIINVII